jgi:hypothetical protein
MLATDFGRNDCLVGNKRVSYEKLQREYRCNECGGKLTLKFKSSWCILCAACGSNDFIHEYKMQQQECDAYEVIDGLPPELAALLK